MKRPIKKRKGFNAYLLTILSFLLVIVIGSILLVTPFSQISGTWAWDRYLDCFFTSVSCTCVTGLCTYEGGLLGTFTLTGQIICLGMIQIGGLGFITVLAFIITLFKRKLQFTDRMFLSQALNCQTLSDVIKFLRRIILIVFIVEGSFFLIGLPAWFEVFPNNPSKALWNSLFMSVSAFNNAGFDILGSSSLMPEVGTLMGDIFVTKPWVWYYITSYVMLLIVAGGLSFLIIIEVFSFKKRPNQYRAFTKICLVTMASLIVFGTLTIFLFDGLKGSNSVSLFNCFFQSITCRTAGFATFDQSNLSLGSLIICDLLMFIGGNPLGTAGGIKTTTVFIIVFAILSFLRSRPVTAFKRKFSISLIVKAMALVFIALILCFTSGIFVYQFELMQGNVVPTDRVFFEIFSAFGTVGLTVGGLTPTLSVGSKIIICILMFLGRLGPMTFFQIFHENFTISASTNYDFAEEEILVG